MNPVLEAIPLGENKSIYGFRHEAPDFETPWHFHPQHELTYIEQSVGTKFIGDYVGSFEPGELVLLRSNLPHCWKNNQQQDKRSISIVVQWNKGIFPRVPELQVVFDLLRTASKGILFDRSQTETVLPLVKQLPVLQGHELYIVLLKIVSTLAKSPFTTLSEKSFSDDLTSQFGERMGKVHDFVSDNYHRRIYLKEMADLTLMSEQSFSRFFTKMMGRSFFSYLNEYRINMVVRMLLDTDESIAQIGFACGYDSLPFFHKQFLKFKGCTPLVYQRRFRF